MLKELPEEVAFQAISSQSAVFSWLFCFFFPSAQTCNRKPLRRFTLFHLNENNLQKEKLNGGKFFAIVVT
jgi:hypothetical protein